MLSVSIATSTALWAINHLNSLSACLGLFCQRIIFQFKSLSALSLGVLSNNFAINCSAAFALPLAKFKCMALVKYSLLLG